MTNKSNPFIKTMAFLNAIGASIRIWSRIALTKLANRKLGQKLEDVRHACQNAVDISELESQFGEYGVSREDTAQVVCNYTDWFFESRRPVIEEARRMLRYKDSPMEVKEQKLQEFREKMRGFKESRVRDEALLLDSIATTLTQKGIPETKAREFVETCFNITRKKLADADLITFQI